MGEAFDELLLCNDEDDEDWQRRQGGGCELDVPHWPAIGVGILGKRLRQREHLGAGKKHDRLEEQVPGMQEGEDGHRCQCRLCQRQGDAGEDLEPSETIDASGLFQFGRKRHEELSHDEGGEYAGRAEDRYQDQRPVSVDHAGLQKHLE
ncbi:hypothetical protein D3C80_1022710 [compost metagenome]